jgi:sugar phosphate isomerase/epimerase
MYAKIGIIGIVGEEMKADYWGTCQKLADLGYQAVEGGAPPEGEDLAEAVQRMHDMGMRYLAVSGNRWTVEEEIDDILERAAALQVKYVIVYFGPTESREQVLEDAAMYNRIGAKCAAQGLKFCYHNHEHEFTTKFDGKSVFDLYVENTDPDKVFFEVDAAWVTFGSSDPVRVLHDHAGRIPIVHLKDFAAPEPVSESYEGVRQTVQFTSVGTGLVNTRGVMQAAFDTGVEWIVIEQDRLNHITALETAAAAIYNLREYGFVEPTYVAPPPEEK